MSAQLAFDFDAPQFPRWQSWIVGAGIPSAEEAAEYFSKAQGGGRVEDYSQFGRSSNCSFAFGDAWCKLCGCVRRYEEIVGGNGWPGDVALDNHLPTAIRFFARQCYAFEQAMHDATGDYDAPSYPKMIELIEGINARVASFEEGEKCPY